MNPVLTLINTYVKRQVKTAGLVLALSLPNFLIADAGADQTNNAEASQSAMDQIGILTSQFEDISALYETIQDESEQKQFLATLEQVRKDLAEFEESARRVYYAIPSDSPDRNESKSLKRKLNDLNELLGNIMKNLEDFQESTDESSQYASKGLQLANAYRSIAIIYALENLKGFTEEDEQWQGTKIKKLFAISIREINTARQSITDFQLDLDKL